MKMKSQTDFPFYCKNCTYNLVLIKDSYSREEVVDFVTKAVQKVLDYGYRSDYEVEIDVVKSGLELEKKK